ncbi:glyoxysomal processing protease, glyoxysomal isoform X2 [Asparagus officinalis]|uniref:glyoxysomal processing protease, glyoxysomal isoform X2 n=2 Tax=Asparagus officinalis TaxID=4686 RepID=UPI00098DE273|nr:glyoxysomal processing protease, glyoxysomal isoform X2 [Asparagus officinalis]
MFLWRVKEYDTNWVRSQPYLSGGFPALLRVILRTNIGVGGVRKGMISHWEESGGGVGVSGVEAGVDKELGTSDTGRKEGINNDNSGASPRWVPSQLLALVDVPASSDALMSLIGAQGGPCEQTSWELSWSLANKNNDPKTGDSASYRQVENDLKFSEESYRKLSLDESYSATVMAKTVTRIAFLGVSSLDIKGVRNIGISHLQKRGDFLLVMGSPFGVLSPWHFYNSISVGTVANCYPAGSNHSSLLMADIHGLPGMEGGPVFDNKGFLTGILTRPLRQRGGIAEIQLVIPWDAIATARSNILQKQSQRIDGSINRVQKASVYASNKVGSPVEDLSLSESSLERAIPSIALVTVGEGAWASGVVLSSHGLILTNAHILEPWRFGKTSLLGSMDKYAASSSYENYLDSVTNEHEASFLNSNYRSYGKISVCLCHREQRMWYGARVVYVSKGPWDVALLQTESIPYHPCPITPEFVCPAIGSTVHVIGHGLLGARSDLSPSASSGVLANIVRVPESNSVRESSIVGTDRRNAPVMLQTTAAVHPGASGGAVVNSNGRLIGLVTCNARHGGGTIIPHLNFSIPCSALDPIFKFSDKQELATLQVLDSPNELLSSIWALMPPPSTGIQALPKKNDKKATGSRFSQFLAEQHSDMTALKDQKHLIVSKFRSKI